MRGVGQCQQVQSVTGCTPHMQSLKCGGLSTSFPQTVGARYASGAGLLCDNRCCVCGATWRIMGGEPRGIRYVYNRSTV